jgi:hypothetical protein
MSTRADRKRRAAKKAQQEAKWYPTAAELQLPQVPAELREQIRARIAPWLAGLHDYDGNRLAVVAGDCWNAAQSFVLTANDPGVLYVEGSWETTGPNKKGPTPVHHGWMTVDGYIVDLMDERFRHAGEWTDEESHYEPLNTYTCEEVQDFYDEVGCWEIISVVTCPSIEEQGDEYDDEYFTRINDSVFKPATERLEARLIAAGKIKPPLVIDPSMQMMFYVPEHEDGSPTCVLHQAFEAVDFSYDYCPGCEKGGYVVFKKSFAQEVKMWKSVIAAIKDTPELHEDLKAIQDVLRTVLRTQKSALNYHPRAFDFETRIEPREKEALAS